MGLFLSIFLGLVGGGFLWIGKKRSNIKMMLWGAGLTIASYFFGGFGGGSTLSAVSDVKQLSIPSDQIAP